MANLSALPQSFQTLDTLNASNLGIEALDRLRPLVFSIETLLGNPDPQALPSLHGLCQLASGLIDEYRDELAQLRDATDAESGAYRLPHVHSMLDSAAA